LVTKIRVQATLAVVEDVPLHKFAELADKILDRDNGLLPSCQSVVETAKSNTMTPSLADLERRISTLEVKRSRNKSRPNFYRRKNFRSKSREKSVSSNSDICYYHKRFGAKAIKCTIPCSTGCHFNLWTRISSKLRYLQKNGFDKS